MRTDIQTIEAFLQKELGPAETETVLKRRGTDPNFRVNFLVQAQVHLAALLYGRNRRSALIRQAEEEAFSDDSFTEKVSSIFK